MLFILIDSFHHAQAKAPEIVEEASEEESLESTPVHPPGQAASVLVWSIPVRAIPFTIEKEVSFRMLHQKRKTPISKRILVNIII
jgi:hypothetical protein